MGQATQTTVSVFNSSMITFLFSTILIIAFLLLMLYIVRKIGNRQSRSKYIKVIDSMSLGRNTTIYLLKLNNKYVFLACTPSSTEIIGQIEDEEDIKEIEISESQSFSKIFFSKMGKNFLKGQIDRLDRM